MEHYTIRSGREEDIVGYRACLGAVARERRYIGLIDAPSLEVSRTLVRGLLQRGDVFLVVEDAGEIVGWCDVARREREGFQHIAELGMGLRADARGKGLGTWLLSEALERVKQLPIERVELQVYRNNPVARRLYREHGFVEEGLRRKARKIDGTYDDIVLMALLLQP